MNTSKAAFLKEIKNDFKTVEELHPLLESISDKKVVMLGEASHGTHEYYNWRAKISKKLIEEYNFNFIAVEGDWPPCYELNRHIKNYGGTETDTLNILRQFNRWPRWMWVNWEVYELAQWLKKHNKDFSDEHKVGFYGLDVYSLYESLDAVTHYLDKQDPDALASAQKAMRCFEPFRDEGGQGYAFSTRMVPRGCSQEVNDMLREIRSNMPVYPNDAEHNFSTEQNAIVIKNAEEYYREMAAGSSYTWNLRDSHMMETLTSLLKYHGENSKAIIWAHNTHIGDARYTDMADEGLYNIGELAREKYGEDQVCLIGFGSYHGGVVAGKSWGAKAEEMKLPKAPENSWESICHNTGEQFYINSDDLKNEHIFNKMIPHRAVGVVYQPQYESFGNYVPTIIPKRYDHYLFFDKTKPLHQIAVKGSAAEVPDTFPFGL